MLFCHNNLGLINYQSVSVVDNNLGRTPGLIELTILRCSAANRKCDSGGMVLRTAPTHIHMPATTRDSKGMAVGTDFGQLRTSAVWH